MHTCMSLHTHNYARAFDNCICSYIWVRVHEYARETDSLFNTHHVTVLRKRAVLSCARVIRFLQGEKVNKCDYIGSNSIGHVAIYVYSRADLQLRSRDPTVSINMMT